MVSETDLNELESKLGVSFNDRNLLKQALTHESYLNEWGADDDDVELSSYERLEFLGDAVLNFAVADTLFERSSNASEGELSMGRANVVCKDSLARAATRIDLGKYILRGNGELAYNSNIRDSMLEDVFEAIIGAIHVDQGMDAASKFVFEQLGSQIAHVIDHGVEKDPKSAFQELVQGAGLKTPRYKTELADTNPNGEQQYRARVLVGGKEVANGFGISKSKAQKHAAAKGLERFAHGVPSEFLATVARSGVNRNESETSNAQLGTSSDTKPTDGMRRFAGWLGGLVVRKNNQPPRRRLVFKRPD